MGILGANVSSALAGKVIFLDKIGKISDFAEVVLKYGEAFSEVHIAFKLRAEADGFSAEYTSESSNRISKDTFRRE